VEDHAFAANVEPVSPVIVRRPEVVEHLPESQHEQGSVFDDDFFREPKEATRVAAVPPVQVAPPIAHVPEPPPIYVPEVAVEPEETFEPEPTLWPAARIPSFAGYAGGSDASSEGDELDIPAFLRKKH
jgi:hypothetical protein